jgi:hypothetical protein
MPVIGAYAAINPETGGAIPPKKLAQIEAVYPLMLRNSNFLYKRSRKCKGC